jgi:putative transcriptional regulator
MKAVDSLRGQLLVAAPSLLDPNFQRTVVLVAEHGDDGAMGVVLNRPGELEVSDAAPVLTELVEPGAVVHVGGPVQPTGVVIVGQFLHPDRAAVQVFDDVGFVAGEPDFDELPDELRRARVFAGLAGWSPGQLEAEIEREDWIVEPAQPEDVFSEDAFDLWGRVLERKGGQFKLLARMPPDPSVN